jgi:hypothetical protein
MDVATEYLVEHFSKVAEVVASGAQKIGQIAEEVAGASEEVAADTVMGVAGIVLLNPRKTGGPDIDELHIPPPQDQQTQTEEPTPQAQPAAAAGGAGRRGGGRNEQKVNQGRKQSAEEKLKDLKKERDQLKSKPNKTPEDKAKLQKIEKAINREIDRQKKSENHSKKDKGAAQR